MFRRACQQRHHRQGSCVISASSMWLCLAGDTDVEFGREATEHDDETDATRWSRT